MSFLVYTYSNPYEINVEPYWDSIKNCAHFCVSQTMVNGMIATYEDFRNGHITTVEKLVNSLYGEWTDNVERYIEQYSLVDGIIKKQVDLLDKVRTSLRFNKKNIVDSVRLLVELGIEIRRVEVNKLTEEQKYVVGIYNKILKSDDNSFKLKMTKSKQEVDKSIMDALTAGNHDCKPENVECETIVFYGIHQFTPMILKMIEEVGKYKNVVLLFNYQNQYKNIYQTWIDVYSAFDVPIKSQFSNEFRPSLLLPTSYEGNLLADKLALLAEGQFRGESSRNAEIVEFNNITEFADYVARVYEAAEEKYTENANEAAEYKKSVLYYMSEQFYAANGNVNDILKIYFPEQFGERHFLAYPIGHFFVSVADMWNMDDGGIRIENMNNITECLCSGIIPENISGELVTTFNKTKTYFERSETITDIIEKLEILERRIKKTEKRQSLRSDSGMDELLKLNYFNVSTDEIERLISALKDFGKVAELFYKDFEQEENNFRNFYSKIKEFIENKIFGSEQLEEEFKDILLRLLKRLENVESIKTNGTFECLKETMSFYLKQESQKGQSANWIVRDFEQIDGDILKSNGQSSETIYHFCCLSDSNMNVGEDERFPWPLNIKFFEYAYEPNDWKYQVYVKAMKEFKNFKKYALIYGLQFNRVKYKLSYIKNEDDITNEMFYMFRILGFKKRVNLLHCKDTERKPVKISVRYDVKNGAYNEMDYYKWKICPYRFVLESLVEGGTKYKEKFLILKYLEVLLELAVCEEMNGKRLIQSDLLDSLNTNYDRIVERFKFAIEIDEADIITNAINFIIGKAENAKYPKFDEEYIKKKKEFIYLSLNNEENGEENILRNKVFGASKRKIERELNYNNLKGKEYEATVDEWCKYCSNKEVCLECYHTANS